MPAARVTGHVGQVLFHARNRNNADRLQPLRPHSRGWRERRQTKEQGQSKLRQ
jgi:hypothetical protein